MATYGGVYRNRREQLADHFGKDISNGHILGTAEFMEDKGNAKQRAKSYAESLLGQGLMHREMGSDDSSWTNATERERKSQQKYAAYYLQSARKNGATAKMARDYGFTNAQLKAAGYSIG